MTPVNWAAFSIPGASPGIQYYQVLLDTGPCDLAPHRVTFRSSGGQVMHRYDGIWGFLRVHQ